MADPEHILAESYAYDVDSVTPSRALQRSSTCNVVQGGQEKSPLERLLRQLVRARFASAT